MKRLIAMLLTGCLILQPLSGSVAAAQEADVSVVSETVVSEAEETAGAPSAAPAVEQPPETENDEMTPGELEGDASGEMLPTQESSDGDVSDAPMEVVPNGNTADASEEEIPGGNEMDVPEGEPGTEEMDAPVTEENGGEISTEAIVPEEGSAENLSGMEPSSEGMSEPLPEGSTEDILQGDDFDAEVILGEDTAGEPQSESEFEFEDSAMDEGIMPDATVDVSGGLLEVKVVSTVPFAESRDVTVTAGNFSNTITLGGGSMSGTVNFDMQTPGEYEVTVAAEKFVPFKQNVTTMAQTLTRLTVYTGEALNGGGRMILGDVNGDGNITEGDENTEGDIQQILNSMRGEYQPSCDLTSDGKVDLSDLQCAVQNLGVTSDKASTEVSTIAQNAFYEEGTTATGLEGLLNGTGSAEFKPAQEAPISNDNPVAVTFEVAGEGETAKLEGMTIQAPITSGEGENTKVESNIADATIEVLCEDSDGNEYIATLTVGNGNKTVSRAMMAFMTLAAGMDVTVLEGEDIAIQEEAPVVLEDETAIADVPDMTDIVDVPEVADIAEDEETMTPVADNGVSGEVKESEPENIPRVSLDSATVTQEAGGSLVLNFGDQIAVKRVTIRITGTTKKEQSLVDIAKVEFVNDMENRIPAPELNVPSFTKKIGSNEEIELAWTEQTNVTGYEVSIEGPVKKQDTNEKQIVRVSENQLKFVSINDKSLKNFGEYKIKVRSINGEWSSPWSTEETVIPQPADRPGRVDNLVAVGGFRSLRVSWKAMDDSNAYMLYYKEENEAEYKPVVDGFVMAEGEKEIGNKLEKNQYTITGLTDNKNYELYVVGWNEIGWGVESRHAVATTKNNQPPELPKYHRLNQKPGKEGELTTHIVSAICGDHKDQKMVASKLDDDKTTAEGVAATFAFNGQKYNHARWALGIVDDDWSSYWTKTDWDDGVAYPVSDLSKGVTVTFDDEYEMSYLSFSAMDILGNPEKARIVYWNNENPNGVAIGARVIRKMDKNNLPYFIVKFDECVKAKAIQLCLGRGYGEVEMKIAEIRFHEKDTLYNDIMDLFGDEMHATLKEGVNQTQIDNLKNRLKTDVDNGETHPLAEFLELDLKAAEELLKLEKSEPMQVDNRITASKDGHLGFGGLNAWQPLGKVATAGDSLVVYVGHNFKPYGENSDLRIIYTQYHAESNALMMSGKLKVGRNELTVPQISNDPNAERAGQLYVAYEGNNSADNYGIRVNGGIDIPVLNIYKKTGEEKANAIKAYVEELKNYVDSIESNHTEIHAVVDKENKKGPANIEYADQTCALNATDLMMEHMMYSVPAKQIWDVISAKNDPAAQLETSLDAMEDAMKLFYQHKGLSNADGAGSRNALPSQHLNIRYMQMFTGAFMYASGNHIGIEYPETRLAASAESMASFGWGIGHEIGHDINQSTYAVAEITNNYFAQLMTINEDSSNTRFDYNKIYQKVTSGAIGRDPNLATQLGLYWQLHLAFDDNKDNKATYENYKDQFDNLFFARVDSYSRTPGNAPKNKDVELKLDGDVDQNLMRLACAAAKQNMLPFFERWGMIPNEDTIAYAALYGERTEKAYYYVNDKARDYRVDQIEAGHTDEPGNVKDRDVVEATVQASGNQAVISIHTTETDPGVILGYEIIRTMYANGKSEPKVIGFQMAGADGTATFTDTVSAINNRVMSYAVKAVDQYLNYSKEAQAGSAKIETGGALSKNGWTVTTTMKSEDDTLIERDGDDPDSGYDADGKYGDVSKYVNSIDRVIDNITDDATGIYHGYQDGEVPAEIMIDMGKETGITSLRYTGSAMASVTISVSSDGGRWTIVKQNYEGLKEKESNFEAVWFDSVSTDENTRANWIGTYDARYVKLEISDTSEVQIKEIDICGPAGDNVEFEQVDGRPTIGRLIAECKYGTKDEDVIPEGSLVFTGSYSGNPAYNLVILYDAYGNVVGAKDNQVKAAQVIFADDPKDGNLGNTSKGYWVYYVEPNDWTENTLQALRGAGGVRAELYRVDDALNLAGERIVSDTKLIEIPDPLPDITLAGVKVPARE